MEAIVKLGNMTVKVEGKTQVDIFKALYEIEEVFSYEPCGRCESENVRHRVRLNKGGDEFFELVCQDCGGVLAFGQSKKEKGRLFPIRKVTADGKASRLKGSWDKKYRGWTKWEGRAEQPADTEGDE